MSINSDKDSLIRKNLFDLYIFFAIQFPLDYNLRIGNNYSFIKSGFSCWPDFIFDIDLKNNPEKTINQINAEIDKGIAPPLILINSRKISSKIEKLLDDSNFRLSMQWTGMALDLDNIELIEVHDNIKITIIDREDDLNAWFEIVNKELFPFNKFKKNIFKEIDQSGEIKLILAKMNDIPVGTSLLFVSSGIAGIYMVAVKEVHRNKGLASLITSMALQEAVKSGCKFCCLQATEMAKNMYLKAGFREFSSYYIYWKVGKF